MCPLNVIWPNNFSSIFVLRRTVRELLEFLDMLTVCILQQQIGHGPAPSSVLAPLYRVQLISEMYQGVGEIVQRLSSFLLPLSKQKSQLLLACGRCKSFGKGSCQLLEVRTTPLSKPSHMLGMQRHLAGPAGHLAACRRGSSQSGHTPQIDKSTE